MTAFEIIWELMIWQVIPKVLVEIISAYFTPIKRTIAIVPPVPKSKRLEMLHSARPQNAGYPSYFSKIGPETTIEEFESWNIASKELPNGYRCESTVLGHAMVCGNVVLMDYIERKYQDFLDTCLEIEKKDTRNWNKDDFKSTFPRALLITRASGHDNVTRRVIGEIEDLNSLIHVLLYLTFVDKRFLMVGDSSSGFFESNQREWLEPFSSILEIIGIDVSEFSAKRRCIR